MLSFRQWLNEGRDYTITNPSSPLEVYRAVGPDVMAPSFIPDNEEDKNVYKAIYSMKADKLYAWWVGNDYHDMIMHKKNITDSIKSEKITIEDIDNTIQRGLTVASIIYFDVKKRTLEVHFSENILGSSATKIKKYIEVGKFKSFAKKFRTVKYVEANSSNFRDYF